MHHQDWLRCCRSGQHHLCFPRSHHMLLPPLGSRKTSDAVVHQDARSNQGAPYSLNRQQSNHSVQWLSHVFLPHKPQRRVPKTSNKYHIVVSKPEDFSELIWHWLGTEPSKLDETFSSLEVPAHKFKKEHPAGKSRKAYCVL